MLPACEPPVAPLPALAIATLMPMTFPSELSRAPPELPGLIAASVWMTGSEIVAVAAVGCCYVSPWPLLNCQKSNGLLPP